MRAILVFCSWPNNEAAEKFAKHAIELKLAACVQISPPHKSFYRWKGQMETAFEVLMTLKTKEALFHDLSAEIRQFHPYEIPEIVSISIPKGNEDYLDWLGQETR